MEVLGVDYLKLEIERLQSELQQRESDLQESAKQGLALLDAKTDLQERFDQLESEFDRLRQERDGLKLALDKNTTARRHFSDLEHDYEQDILEERRQAEEEYIARIKSLETENRSTKAETERCYAEIRKLQEWMKLLEEDKEQLKVTNEKLHKENAERRSMEKLLSAENAEIHEDTVRLRKQLANLELRTKEFESVKFESRKLLEEKELLQYELDETRRLSEIVKQQAEEAWKALEIEREHRRAIQRQMHEQTEDRERWNRMASLRLEVGDDGDAFEESSSSPPQSANLFSELQFSASEKESQIAEDKHKFEQILNVARILELLASNWTVLEQKNPVMSACSEIQAICQETGGLSDQSAFVEEISAQISRRTGRQVALETKVTQLSSALEGICEMLVEKQLALNSFIDNLAALRTVIGSSSSTVPSGALGPSQDGSVSPSRSAHKSTQLREEIIQRIGNIDDLPDIIDLETCGDLETLVLCFEDVKRQILDAVTMRTSRATDVGVEDNYGELVEENNRLKAHLNRKRDEANLLKEALKMAQDNAEKSLESMRNKYDQEKDATARTLAGLRKELNQRKEDAAMFASMRSMLSARCDDYVTQLENVNRQLKSSDEEKRTLNQLLRMAIQQKLNLIHRVEDLECALDGHNQQRRREPRPPPPRANFRVRGGRVSTSFRPS